MGINITIIIQLYKRPYNWTVIGELYHVFSSILLVSTSAPAGRTQESMSFFFLFVENMNNVRCQTSIRRACVKVKSATLFRIARNVLPIVCKPTFRGRPLGGNAQGFFTLP